MRKILSTGASLVLVAALASPAWAGWEEGVAAFKAGDYQTAAQHFKELVESRGDCVQCYQMYGQCLLKLGRVQEAVTEFRKAYDLRPDDDAIRLPLAQAYVQARRYSDALSLLDTMNPKSLDKPRQQAFFQLRAIALDKSGRSDEMVDDLRKAASANTSDAKAQYTYGAACLSNQDSSCAVPALRNAVRLAPGNTDMKRSLTKALLLQGRQNRGSAKQSAYTEAAQVAEQLVAASSSHDNLVLLGEAQLGSKSYGQAAATFQRAVDSNSTDWLALYYLGQAQTSTGRFGPAEDNLKRALAKASSAKDETLIWRQLGYVYEKQKSYDAAIAAYRKVGDAGGIQRVEENQRIANENEQIEDFNRQVEAFEVEKRKIQEEMKDLPPD